MLARKALEIGVAEPVSVNVDAHGHPGVDGARLSRALTQRPSART